MAEPSDKIICCVWCGPGSRPRMVAVGSSLQDKHPGSTLMVAKAGLATTGTIDFAKEKLSPTRRKRRPEEFFIDGAGGDQTIAVRDEKLPSLRRIPPAQMAELARLDRMIADAGVNIQDLKAQKDAVLNEAFGEGVLLTLEEARKYAFDVGRT